MSTLAKRLRKVGITSVAAVSGLGLASIIVVVMVVRIVIAQASTQPSDCSVVVFGRCLYEGYFTGDERFASGGVFGEGTDNLPMLPAGNSYTDSRGALNDNMWAFPQSTDEGQSNPSAAFVSFVRDTLLTADEECGVGDPSEYNGAACALERRRAIGGAVIVQTMLGSQGNTWSGDMAAGVADARARVADWEDLVNDLSGGGNVDWNESLTLTGSHLTMANVGIGDTASDVTLFEYNGDRIIHAIIFSDPSTGNRFILDRQFGAPTAEFSSLPITNQNVQAEILPDTSGSSAANFQPLALSGANYLVEPGARYRVYVRARNIGNASAGQVALQVPNLDTGMISSAGSVQTLNIASNFYDGDGGGVGCGATQLPFCPDGQDGWYWQSNNLGAYDGVPGGNDEAQGWFGIQINPAAPIGSRTCFALYVHPSTPSGGFDTDGSICVAIEEPSEPRLDVVDGGVHAGAVVSNQPCLIAGPTSNPSSEGFIRGLADSGTQAEYVVSAGGRVDNFPSAGGDNTVTFGNNGTNGSYGQICRPDLATRLLNQTSNFVELADYTGMNNVPGDVVTKIRRDIVIPGALIRAERQSTIVVEGDVYITGNITEETTGYNLSGGNNDVPSLAIVATGNINIAPSVTDVFGVLYAGSSTGAGLINTCSDNAGGPSLTAPGGASACGNVLHLNGSLIAGQIQFRRTGSGVGSSGSEEVTLAPQIFLAPPPGMDALLSRIEYQGERPPVF